MSFDGAPSASRARVRSFYDHSVAHESGRLAENVYRRLERDMTLWGLSRFVPRGAKLLDVGGGPGAYLQPLRALGYEVSLCDLSRQNVRRARERAIMLGDPALAKRIRQADATRLEAYANASFDAALVAGPLYHLTDARSRRRALAEVLRVLRPGGVAVFNVLPRLHPLRYLLREASAESRECFRGLDWTKVLSSGRYRHAELFTDAYLWRIDELVRTLRAARCRVLDLYSAESFAAFLDVPLCEWIETEADYQHLLRLVQRTAREREQIGAAEHVIAIARAPGKSR